jgi:hypothetical protein
MIYTQVFMIQAITYTGMYQLCMKIQYCLETLGKGKPIELVIMGQVLYSKVSSHCAHNTNRNAEVHTMYS